MDGIPDSRVSDVRRAADVLRASRRAVLTTHLNADGDGAGSQIALAAWMRAQGAEPVIVNPTPFPDRFRFLLPNDRWVLDAGSEAARHACEDADLAVVLDTGEFPRIGRIKPMIQGLPTVVVDHHPMGDQAIGGTSLRDSTASATGELVYDLMQATAGPWPTEALDAIYVAILTDTGSFRFSNSTPRAHRLVADLIERGVDPERLHAQVYGQAPLRRFKLLQAALETLEVEAGVGTITVPSLVFEELGANSEDIEGLVDYPRGVEGVHVALLFRSTSKGIKISLRSDGLVDVNALARQFGGGGHVRASGALLEGTLDEVRERVVEATRAAVAAAG